MGFGEILKKTALGTVKVAGSAVLGAVGIASTVVEEMGAAAGVDFVADIGHGLKSASFNGVREMWGQESKEYDHRTGEVMLRNIERSQQAAEQAIKRKEQELKDEEEQIKRAQDYYDEEQEEKYKEIRKKIDKPLTAEQIMKDLEKNKEKQEKVLQMKDKLKESEEKAEEIRKRINDNKLEKMYQHTDEIRAHVNDKKTMYASTDNSQKKNIKEEYANAPKVKGQRGHLGIAFLFSCPGQVEMNEGHVCAGMTGENLNVLLEYLNQARGDLFKSPSKEDYTITNASDRVHYMELTGDTEASILEISLPENLSRLEREIGSCKYLICMGSKAATAASKIHSSSQKIIRSEHLSNMHLNRAYYSDEESPEERRKSRVGKVAEKILQQL